MARDRSRDRTRDEDRGESSRRRARSRSRSPRLRLEGDKDRSSSSRKERVGDDGRDRRDRDRDRDRDDDRRGHSDKRRERSRSRDRHGSGEDGSRRKSRRKDDGSEDDSDDDRKARRREKRQDKLEAAEEKRLRKKARKDRDDEAARTAAEEQRRAAAELSVYGAGDNPFNDADLTQQFVWGKKRDKEKKQGISVDEAKRKDAERRIEAKEELERLNKRRADREKELEERERDATQQARAAESAQMEAWHAKENDFHLEQAMRRAQIRTREGRAKPIDLLALNLKWSKPYVPKEDGNADEDDDEEDEGVGMDIDLEEPYLLFENLSLEETEELYEDIQMYISLETDEANLEFWRSMVVVCSAALEPLRTERTLGRQAFIEQNRASQAVKADIANLLRGKSLPELRQLQDSVQAKLQSGDPIDVEYWEGLMRELAVWMSKSKLKAMHEVALRNRLEHLRRKQRDEAVRVQEDLAKEVQDEQEAEAAAARAAEAAAMEDGAGELSKVPEVVREAWTPSMEPKGITRIPMEDRHLEIVDPKKELADLIAARRLVAQARFVPKKARGAAEPIDVDAGDALAKAAASKGLDEDEEVWNAKDEVQHQTYSWQDKYRPRKPRYFNKVITGFDWNKYNQTHYDIDNPPPKVVQSYRFTIFCPDLVDITKAPTYRIQKEPGNDDTCILHFRIGPPYEDLAFRIVNKEWEYSHKKGFKSTFDRGVLQLHFNFKRTFYRK